MMDIKPENKGNSNIIIERHSNGIVLPMLRYESIFDFYSEEPLTISVQKKNAERVANYEQILRIRKWNTKNRCISWSIYSVEREELNDIVIRKVEWDMRRDKEYVKANIRNNNLLTRWPSIITENNYIPQSHSQYILKEINELDLQIGNGILLEENKYPNWEWRDLEIKRLYDWGQVHNTWSTNMKNQKIEDKIVVLTSIFKTYIKQVGVEAEIISLNYSVLPESYKNLVELNK